ncbi:MAG: malonyl-ACP O-methyltransferase BioC [Gammaproteobacteria bacterium]
MSEDPIDHPMALLPADVARVFDRAASTYRDAAVVARASRDELLDRLEVVTLEPSVILDAGCGDGGALGPLRTRYPEAQIIALDVSPAMVERAVANIDNVAGLVGDAHTLDLPTASVDLVFCNQMLPWCYDSEKVLAQFRRVLRPGGLLHLATLGPDTLGELRRAFARVDDEIHVHYFYDMHDIGDAIGRAGFAEPVMDVDTLTLTYPHLDALLRDLRAAGSGNVARGRARGLFGRQRLAALARAYDPLRRDGRLPLSYEIVYGQAWAAALRPQKILADGNVAVPFENLRRSSR